MNLNLEFSVRSVLSNSIFLRETIFETFLSLSAFSEFFSIILKTDKGGCFQKSAQFCLRSCKNNSCTFPSQSIMNFSAVAIFLIVLITVSSASILPADYASCQEDEYKGMTNIA